VATIPQWASQIRQNVTRWSGTPIDGQSIGAFADYDALVTEVAPGVHRAGTDLVNWYLVEDSGRVTLVDAGVPGYWSQLDPALADIGRTRDDVEALVLTHGDADHVGFAERLRTETGARVLVHSEDVELTTTKKQKRRDGSVLPELRRPHLWKIFTHLARNGGGNVPPVGEVTEFAGGDVLDVPGRPVAVHTPGHTPGHCVIHFADRGVVMVGDALCTLHPTRGTRGPQLMPSALNTDTDGALAALDAIAALDAATVLPGHGEPFTGGAAAAVEQARAAGVT
jgi:glyoxylase-like metal-dependent hydrolase (beta-lactamase superfamily II)